jgi:hypothetical protein
VCQEPPGCGDYVREHRAGPCCSCCDHFAIVPRAELEALREVARLVESERSGTALNTILQRFEMSCALDRLRALAPKETPP